VNLQAGLLIGEANVKPPSRAGDDAAEMTWPRHDVDADDHVIVTLQVHTCTHQKLKNASHDKWH
jgi:hypothetical protein